MVVDVVAEFIATKRRSGKSDRYLADIKGRLEAFTGSFNLHADAVTAAMLQAYSNGLKGSSGLVGITSVSSRHCFALRCAGSGLPATFSMTLPVLNGPQSRLVLSGYFSPRSCRLAPWCPSFPVKPCPLRRARWVRWVANGGIDAD